MLPFIVTAEHFYRVGDHVIGADRALRAYEPPLYVLVAPTLTRRGELDTSVSTHAYVNHGNWIADCPFCPSAQLISFNDPRFLCASGECCVNAAVKGAYVPVVVPTPSNRAAIEEALLKRPVMASRNWRPGETVPQLRAENKEHGIT
jgi:hypothetical protein